MKTSAATAVAAVASEPSVVVESYSVVVAAAVVDFLLAFGAVVVAVPSAHSFLIFQSLFLAFGP